jgi:diacylglycerol kinase family enzyme
MADVVNELAKGAGLGAVPVAMLPLGNENLFAREFGFDRNVERLSEAVGRGDSRRIDVGLLGERVFTLMASVGFDAEVVHRLAAWRAGGAAGASGKLRRVSRWSYVPRMLAGLRGYGYPRLTVEADGVKVSGSHVFVFNLPWYGMHLGIGAGAKGDDGLLDWVVFERAGARAVVGYMGSVWAGRHRRRADVVSGRAKRVKVEAEGPAAVQADGDPAGFTPMEAVVSAGALRVVEMRGL